MATGYVVPEQPDWTRPRLAPAGDKFAAVRWQDGAANVWIGTGNSPMQLVSDLQPWRLRGYHWGAGGDGLVLELQLPGAEQHVVAWLDLRARTLTRLTPGLGADAQYAGQSDGDKPSILIGVRHPFTSGFQLQAVTPGGAVLAEWESPDRPAGRWLASATQAVAVHSGDGPCEWWYTGLARPSWSRILTMPVRDGELSVPLAFGEAGSALYALSSAGRDTIALVSMSAPDWTPRVLSAEEGFDVTSVLMSPDGTGPDLVTTTNPVTPQTALTDDAAADLSQLKQVADGAAAAIIGRNQTHCLAEVSMPVGGPVLVTISRASGAVSKPLARFASLARVRTQRRDPVSYPARDGRQLTGFVTRPSGPPPWPVVLAVHDGPWARDGAQLDPWAQSVAAAGLCCLQVNYRGSRGFGKAFRDSGDGQWSLAMQDDLIDALRAEDLAEFIDTSRVAAIGYGYGGYAALMLATQAEIPLAAVAAASAPTDLVRYVGALLSFGGQAGLQEAARIGDPVADADQLTAASPIARAADFRAPVLLFHGRQDARVPVSQATALAGALMGAGRSCELTIYEDEGHRYVRPQNVASLRTLAINFLLRNLSPSADPAVR
ncbi:MAG TPA: prolyl oligopeptidase family serine peptidase [Streptosporangiaceae bacterium]|nr:prolyl oligopeptidase family serine peptidase [Streptosporangiaceae bacterium]